VLSPRRHGLDASCLGAAASNIYDKCRSYLQSLRMGSHARFQTEADISHDVDHIDQDCH
jgi:hypothetical protein